MPTSCVHQLLPPQAPVFVSYRISQLYLITCHLPTHAMASCTHTLLSNTICQIDNSAGSEDEESRKRRICRSGCGVERTAGKGDTPGFPSRGEATITRDPRGHKKVELPRPAVAGKLNTVQSSLHLAQSWRANCDLQFMFHLLHVICRAQHYSCHYSIMPMSNLHLNQSRHFVFYGW